MGTEDHIYGSASKRISKGVRGAVMNVDFLEDNPNGRMGSMEDAERICKEANDVRSETADGHGPGPSAL